MLTSFKIQIENNKLESEREKKMCLTRFNLYYHVKYSNSKISKFSKTQMLTLNSASHRLTDKQTNVYFLEVTFLNDVYLKVVAHNRIVYRKN